MKTTKLTVAQALVRFLDNQYLEVDGKEIKFIKGIFAIFNHGNVVGLGQALEQNSGELHVHQGRNEQGMAHAAIGYHCANEYLPVLHRSVPELQI
ncbi:MAG: 3D-(3,5/4)-trihydroxycyclohexane-1,2-dione hydrolase [Candidatus Celerinatantimonas neptuna]|nr:MAG: 3D-(3,5/4)-trihydroxycyclohexane-1,2-dione hydrolase [Candidatus Celerinatantimonas neptuna]